MDFLKKMVETLSVSGNEEKLADLIEREVKGYADEISRDVMGNLIVLKKGSGKAPKKMMLSAHMDEIGFVVTYIDDKGFVHFSNVGGLSVANITETAVVFKNGVKGIMSYQKKKKLSEVTIKDFYIDIGAESKAEAEKMVSIGDFGGFYGVVHEIGKHRIASKAIDDKIACYVQIETLKKLKNCVYDTYFVFSVQEEVGLRGAIASAYNINPDYGIALDVTICGDQLGSSVKNDIKLGGGAAIKVKDMSIVCSRQMVEFLTKTARAAKIPYQMEVLAGGGTDAGAIHLTRGGVLTGAISIPSRYVHSRTEMVDKRDVDACVNLLIEVLAKEI